MHQAAVRQPAVGGEPSDDLFETVNHAKTLILKQNPSFWMRKLIQMDD